MEDFCSWRGEQLHDDPGGSAVRATTTHIVALEPRASAPGCRRRAWGVLWRSSRKCGCGGSTEAGAVKTAAVGGRGDGSGSSCGCERDGMRWFHSCLILPCDVFGCMSTGHMGSWWSAHPGFRGRARTATHRWWCGGGGGGGPTGGHPAAADQRTRVFAAGIPQPLITWTYWTTGRPLREGDARTLVYRRSFSGTGNRGEPRRACCASVRVSRSTGL